MGFPSILCLLVFTLSLSAQTGAEKKQTLDYLHSLQQADGGFISAVPDPKAARAELSNLRSTSSAVRAIHYLGGELKIPEKTQEFVTSCYDATKGTFSDRPGTEPTIASTAIGLMAVNELKIKLKPDEAIKFLLLNAKTYDDRRLAVAGMEAVQIFPNEISAWFEAVAKSANADGSYGEGDGQARETGGVAAMYLRSGTKLGDEQKKQLLAVMKAGQRTDGGYGKAGAKSSDLESTYRVMRAMYLMKEKPESVEKLRAFMAKCRNNDGGYGVEPGKPSNVGGVYYMAIINKWLAE